jgi:hypothetical protein
MFYQALEASGGFLIVPDHDGGRPMEVKRMYLDYTHGLFIT